MATFLLSMAGAAVGTGGVLFFIFCKIQEILWTDEDVMYEELD